MVHNTEEISITTIHEGEKVHKCVCGKSFAQSKNLKRHIWIVHEKRKIYECDMCENQFHENSHENDFTKDEMMKSWRNKTVHEGIKDHKCTECGKIFHY